jgi:hypothetical protein
MEDSHLTGSGARGSRPRDSRFLNACRGAFLGVGALALLAAGPAWATDFVVGTDAQLRAALDPTTGAQNGDRIIFSNNITRRGLNRWSNVHIADVAALYTLAIAKAPASTFMYVESGEGRWPKSRRPSRPDLVSTLHNPGPPSRRSPPGVGTWQRSRSAQTAVCAAKPPPISAGHRPSGQSRAGSPANSLSIGI